MFKATKRRMNNKKYKNYGQVDFEDHEIEAKIERDERLNDELNPDTETW